MAATQQQPSSTGIRLHVVNQTSDAPVETGPDKIISGYVEVDQALLRQTEKIEIQYRGVEVAGGTLSDFDDNYVEGLQPRAGMRAFSKVYFDERLTVWQRSEEKQQQEEASGNTTTALPRRFDFSIAFPHANYPAQVHSTCEAAPLQSFEIAYHVVGWTVGADGGVLERAQAPIGFVPRLTRTLPQGAMVPQAPLTQTAYDERGRECLFTRVTLSQADYVPGDQVVAGVYIECIKSNRTVRKADAQLRQRVECRMRRTYSSAETAELVASGSRPQSSQPSTHSDDSDVLWTRALDIGAPQPLTLTRTGVGLAAAAASGCTTPGTGVGAISGPFTGSLVAASTCSLSSSDHVAEPTPVPEKRESTLARAIGPKGSGIIAGYRSCSANMHTHIPASASAVPGHFLIFSYELLIDVTLSSLTRGNHKVSTRTPLGSATGAATPGSANGGFTLARHRISATQPLPPLLPHPSAVPYHRALSSLQPSASGAEAAAPNGSGSYSATAACFPQNQQSSGGGMLDGREKAQLKGGNRFSVGAFQGGGGGGSTIPNANDGAESGSTPGSRPGVRYSTIQAAPIHRGTTQSSVIDSEGGAVLPNAVDLMRFKYDTSVVVVPKIFVPVAIAEADAAAVALASGGTDTSNDVAVNGCGDDGENAASDVAADDAHIASSASSPLFSTATADGEPGNANAINSNSPPSKPRQVHAVASECDLARAVYAAAEKVLNDKEWDRPNSIYLAVAPKLDKKKTRRQKMANVQVVGGFEDSDETNVSPLVNSIKRNSASTSGTDGTDEEAEEEDEEEEEEDMDVQRAINRLAPQSRSSSLNGGVHDIISGIDFFGAGADAAGPELTGLLSADPDKLVFGAMPMITPGESPVQDGSPRTEEQGVLVASSSATAYSPAASRDDDTRTAEQPSGKKHSPALTAALPSIQRINSVLRRSISMPGRGPSLNAVVAATATATNTDSSSSTADMRSPGSTVARSAFETGGTIGSKVLIRKNFLSRVGRSNSTALDGSVPHLAGMSPRSMVSAVSSASPLGANSRVGVFRTLSHRFTSWFKK